MNHNTCEYVGVVVNRGYGAFTYSDQVKSMYNGGVPKRKSRFDPAMVDIIKKLGTKQASGFRSRLTICYVPKMYINHLNIQEYDGYESVEIDINAYIIDASIEMLNATELSNDEKVETMRDLLLQPEFYIEVYYDNEIILPQPSSPPQSPLSTPQTGLLC